MDGYIENKIFDEIEVGDFASVEHMLTQKDAAPNERRTKYVTTQRN